MPCVLSVSHLLLIGMTSLVTLNEVSQVSRFDDRNGKLRIMLDRVARRRFLQGLTAIPALGLLEQTAIAQKPRDSTIATHSAPKVALNVRDFGAKGDGNTNDTSAFQT